MGYDISHRGRGALRSRPTPVDISAFCEPSYLLPGENQRDFEVIRQIIIDEIQPESNLEWLWILDLVELSWETLRYRRLKHRVLREYRHAAIAAILLRLDSPGMPSSDLSQAHIQTKRNAAEWRDDSNAADEIEARLNQHGFDAAAINAEVFYQAREIFSMFDQLMLSAQNRRMSLLREISSRRQDAKRVNHLNRRSQTEP
jgi:hypothetical protein